MNQRQAILAATRPQTLLAAAAPVAVGAALAAREGAARPLPLIAALLCALALQIAANVVNDLADFERGADGEDRLGPPRAAAEGWLSPAQLRGLAALALGLAAATGLYLAWIGGPVILAVGIASLLSAVAYTAGPYPLGYHGLGEVFVFLFFGLAAVWGTAWVGGGPLDAPTILSGGVVGALATAILVVNNLRDRHGDARAGKRTLTVRFGEALTRRGYAALLISAYLGAGAIALLGHPRALLSWLSLPLAIQLIRALWTEDGAALNPRLGGTARLELVFAALLAVGLL